jgi:DnaJ-class molecular chaperone
MTVGDGVAPLPEREEGGARVCQTCGGRGWRVVGPIGGDSETCPACDGTGEVRDGNISSNG